MGLAMTAATYNLAIDQGADFAIELVIKEDGVIKDLTGYFARSQIRNTKDAGVVVSNFTCTISAPATGAIAVTMHNSVSGVLSSGAYVYDVELFTVDDGSVTRVIEGAVAVSRGVTR